MGTNDFSQETKHLFDYYYSCFECGRNNIADFHHICKRGTKHQQIENSPLNCAVLCRKCHQMGDIHSHKKQTKYLNQTANFLIRERYELTTRDYKFLEKYKAQYEQKVGNV